MSATSLKGYRIEIAGCEWVHYVVAESAARAKSDIWYRANDASFQLRWGDIRSCRRCPALDGMPQGEHATYDLIAGQEFGLRYHHNRTDVHALIAAQQG